MEFFQSDATEGVPIPGPYYIYNYFTSMHNIFCIMNYLGFGKINFSMILIKYQQVHVNTTTIFISMMADINSKDLPPRQYIAMGHSVRLSISFTLKEG